ncbi:hypothetical protein GYA54_03180 [Candidatus Kuenenbacteria bacterium]|nr:hypothetical protein [Candidatus Kuenenbacteria bacterium]
MVNSEKQFSREQFRESRPDPLDIIKINGRWAQVFGAGSPDEIIRYLDGDEEYSRIYFNKLELLNKWETGAINLKAIYGVELPEEIVAKAKGGYEEEEDPELKVHITVFGEYVDKSKE